MNNKKIIKLSELEITPDRNTTKKDIIERGLSIQAVGLIEPITISKDMKKVVVGRTRALGMIHIGWDELKNTSEKIYWQVSSAEDDDIIAFVENESRKQLSSAEEVNAVLKFKKKYDTIEAVAEIMGKTNYWVASRVVLDDLIDEFKDIFLGENKKNQFLNYKLKHWTIVAQQKAETQKQLLSSIGQIDLMRPAQLAEWICQKCYWDVSEYPFDGCGVCEMCNDKGQNYLFEDMKKDGYCKDLVFLEEQKEKLLQDKLKDMYDTDKTISEDWNNKEVNYSLSDINIVEKPTETSIKLLCVDGHNKGQYIDAEIRSWATDNLAPKESEKELTPEEIEEENEKRLRRGLYDGLNQDVENEITSKKLELAGNKFKFCEAIFGLEAFLGSYNATEEDVKKWGFSGDYNGIELYSEFEKCNQLDFIAKLKEKKHEYMRKNIVYQLGYNNIDNGIIVLDIICKLYDLDYSDRINEIR